MYVLQAVVVVVIVVDCLAAAAAAAVGSTDLATRNVGGDAVGDLVGESEESVSRLAHRLHQTAEDQGTGFLLVLSLHTSSHMMSARAGRERERLGKWDSVRERERERELELELELELENFIFQGL